MSVSIPALTKGAIHGLLSNRRVTDEPVLQIMHLKKIEKDANSSDRYRVQLSDGEFYYGSCMVATQLNCKAIAGDLDAFSIIRLKKFLNNRLPNSTKPVLVVVDCDCLVPGSQVGDKIGNPLQINPDSAMSALPPPPPVDPVENKNSVKATSGQRDDIIDSSLKRTAQVESSPRQGSASNFYGNSSSRTSNPPPPKLARTTTAASANGAATGSATFDPPANIFPVTSLTPYQNRWTIRARVISKPAMRTYTNPRGEGKLFNVDLIDESGEIRATAFNKEAEKFFPMLTQNGVYYISRGSVKPANKQFSNIQNDYEITFNSDTLIQPCGDDSNIRLPTQSYHFVPLRELPQHKTGELVDVIGIVKSFSDLQTIRSKAGKEFEKREIQLIDDSETVVNLTIWGLEARDFSGFNNPVLLAKAAKISDFGGCSLSTVSQSVTELNPDVDRSHELRGWYDEEGHAKSFQSLSSGVGGGSASGRDLTSWTLLAVAQQTVLKNIPADKAEFFTMKGTIIQIRKEGSLYKACANRNSDCKKKVIDLENGKFRCEKCCVELDTFRWRLMLSVSIVDSSDNAWVTCFEEQAVTILGESAENAGRMSDEDPDAFEQLFDSAMFKTYTFRLKGKMETYNDETRLKLTAVTIAPVDYLEYGRHIQKDIEKWKRLDD